MNDRSTERPHLFFHAPCFDGIASAALAWEHLDRSSGWADTTLFPVNYDSKNTWLKKVLPVRSAVVDFLFHPSASVWFDHHPTSFLSAEAHRAYLSRKNRKIWIYERKSPSCARLIWEWAMTLPSSSLQDRSTHFRDLVEWADRIDAARYRSIEELRLAEAPALQINGALAVNPSGDLCRALVLSFRRRSLAEIASQRDVQTAFRDFRIRSERGLERLRSSSTVIDGIVVFDVDSEGVLIDRFAPYFLRPHARSSVGLTRSRRRIVLRAMRNPWREVAHPPLGDIAAVFGGGGHARIGSVVFQPDEGEKARHALGAFVSAVLQDSR